jgi:hypothetical protein
VAKIKVEVKPGRNGPVVSLRPLAFIDGPRKVGYCAGCKRLCQGLSTECDLRVFEEAQQIRAGKSIK